METIISNKDPVSFPPRIRPEIKEEIYDRKNTPDNFRYSQNENKPGMPGLSHIPGIVPGSPVQKNEIKTISDRVHIRMGETHCLICARAGFSSSYLRFGR